MDEIAKIILAVFILAFFLVGIALIAVNVFRLIQNAIFIHRYGVTLTDLFIELPHRKKERHVIEQKTTRKGRKMIHAFRKKHHCLPIRTKMIAVSKFFSKELLLLLDKLTPEQSYSCITHLLKPLKNAQRKGIITIQESRFERKRMMFETITLIGVMDFCRCIFNSKLRPLLRRNFYLVHFTKTSTTEEISNERTE